MEQVAKHRPEVGVHFLVFEDSLQLEEVRSGPANLLDFAHGRLLELLDVLLSGVVLDEHEVLVRDLRQLLEDLKQLIVAVEHFRVSIFEGRQREAALALEEDVAVGAGHAPLLLLLRALSLAVEQLEKDAANAPHVSRLVVVRLYQTNFWGPIPPRTHMTREAPLSVFLIFFQLNQLFSHYLSLLFFILIFSLGILKD